MRFPSGQPWWQKGMPQSMQRPAWRETTERVPFSRASYTSRQSIRRTGTGRRAGSSRSRVRRNPRGSAMGGLHDLVPDIVRIGVDPPRRRVLPDRGDGEIGARGDLGESSQQLLLVGEQRRGAVGAGAAGVLADDAEDLLAVLLAHRGEREAGGVLRVQPVAVEVQDVE